MSCDIRVVVNGPLEDLGHFYNPYRLRSSRWDKPFNFSACINFGVKESDDWHSGYGMPCYHGYPRTDILILNDDTRLLTPGGFDALRDAAYAHPECGLMFPSVTGCTGNPEQITQPGNGVRYAQRHVVPFIGVYIRRAVWDEIGPMDEDFCEDYGFEDAWYCSLVRAAGYQLGIFDGCVIEHGELPSTYRKSGNCSMHKNRAIYERKWKSRFSDMPVVFG